MLRGALKYFKWAADRKSLGTTALTKSRGVKKSQPTSYDDESNIGLSYVVFPVYLIN